MNTIVEKFYKDHQVKPFISPERDLDTWFLNPKPVSKRNMELLADDYTVQKFHSQMVS